MIHRPKCRTIILAALRFSWSKVAHPRKVKTYKHVLLLTQPLASSAVGFEGVVAGVDVAAQPRIERVSVLALHRLGFAAVTAPEVVAELGVLIVAIRLGTREHQIILSCEIRRSVTHCTRPDIEK